MSEPIVDNYKPMSIRFSPASIPQIVAHIQKWLVEHPYISLETVATLIEEALQEHPELINGSVIPITEEDTESIKDYIDALPVSDTYTKSEIDTKLAGKENTLTFDSQPTENSTNPVTSTGIYTYINNVIDIIDAALALKADKIDTYTKTATDNLLNDKADKSNVYTKNTIDAKLEAKADINDVITYETAEQIMDDIAVRSEDGTAPKALSTGQYVIVNEVLYQLTANVQSGDTLTLGTNIRTVPDGGLNLLNSQKADQGTLAYVINGDTYSGVTIPDGSFVYWNGVMYTANGPIPSGSISAANFTSLPATGGLNSVITTLLASAFLYRSNTGDVNTFQDGITIVTNVNTLNTPSANRYAVLTFTLYSSPGRKVQVAFGVSEIFIRYYSEPTWTNWQQVAML